MIEKLNKAYTTFTQEAFHDFVDDNMPEIIRQLEQAEKMREALEWYADQMCEGYCQDQDPKTCAFIGSDNCSGCPAVVALNQTNDIMSV